MSLSIENSIQNFKQRFEISDNCMFIVGVSGGLDSMVLLHAIKNLNDKIIVAHVNYKLRAEDSMNDASLVEKTAMSYQLPFEKLVYDLQADLNKNGGNLQKKARDIRYKFFSSIMDKYEDAKLILAHHQGDQIENFWMQMARGGGIRAMSGLKEVKLSFTHMQLSIILNGVKTLLIKTTPTPEIFGEIY